MSSTDYSQYNGKKVTVFLNEAPEGGEPSLEGTVDTGTEMGLLFKPKGKASLELIDAANIASIELAPETPKKLAVKALLPLKDSGARQHLIDRHAYKVEDIEPLSEADALTFHDSEVSHEGLGHNHDGKPKDKKADEAAASDDEAAA